AAPAGRIRIARLGRVRLNVPLRIAVAGGSIRGPCAGIALRGVGCEGEGYERTPGAKAGRGAGVVVPGELSRLPPDHGDLDLPTASCVQRQYLRPEGGEIVATPLQHRFTSWYAIYRTLRSAFPDERYHPGSTLTGFEQADARMIARFAELGDVEADLLV